MDMFEQILALTEDRTVRMALALAAVLFLILIIAAVYRRIARRGLSIKRGRVARLAILEAIPVDQRRRLILLRRDNTEHLVMIGGPTDLVVEEGIRRQARQPASKRPAPDRAVIDQNDGPRVPSGAKNTESIQELRPVSSTHEVTHAPAPVLARTPASTPIAPATATAAIVATSVAASAGSTPSPTPDPVVATPIIPAATVTEEDPQIAEMERKLQDALKTPEPDNPEAPAENNASEDLELPDIESSLEAAIADAVASDSADATTESTSENDSGSLTERLENITSGESPPG